MVAPAVDSKTKLKNKIQKLEEEIKNEKDWNKNLKTWISVLKLFISEGEDEIQTRDGGREIGFPAPEFAHFNAFSGSLVSPVVGTGMLTETINGTVLNSKLTAMKKWKNFRKTGYVIGAPLSDGPVTVGGSKYLDNWKIISYQLEILQNVIESAKKQLKSAKDRLAISDDTIAKKQRELDNLNNELNGGGGSGVEPSIDDEWKPVTKKEAMAIQYKMNIPMVKSAYYQKGLNHLQMTLAQNPNYTYIDNGRKMWLGDNPGKGVIQADAQFLANYKNKTWVDNYGRPVENPDLYGFRFLYNPMTITQNWGVRSDVSPTFVGMGMDAAVPISPNLISSNISFELWINRIEDMNHIDANGWKKPGIQPRLAEGYQLDDVDTNPPQNNPWPMPGLPGSFNDHLKEIYRKGTLYDLEYLFAAQFPGTKRFKSTLNGKTFDWGWLTGYSVEVHLGAGMRYRGRISDINVTHILFNERMVPLLSQIQLSIMRYPDVKQERDAVGSTTSSSSSSSSGGTSNPPSSQSPRTSPRTIDPDF